MSWKNNHDSTLEVSDAELRGSSQLRFSNDPAPLQGANVYIVTVPTPIDRHRRPDLTPLQGASRTIGQVIKPGDVVIYRIDGLSGRDRRGVRARA
jgi:UDP-N-acetyl-D-galactosamine dehydrogenase